VAWDFGDRMTDAILIESFQRLLADAAPVSDLRTAKTGLPACWTKIEASGYLDALLPEALGGAGLSLDEIEPLVCAMGAGLLPAPVAETMVARLWSAQAGLPMAPGMAVVLAPASAIIPLAGHATHALVPRGARFEFVRLEPSAADPFHAGAGVVAHTCPVIGSIPAGNIDLLAAAAALLSARMAGAMSKILTMSIEYANAREQFGRPLGKFQAVQHNLAIMAEEVLSARSASRIGLAGPSFDALRSAAAKARVSEAAQTVCSLAHAVHGAIGVTSEHDLHLYTTRLMQGRIAFGSERYWGQRLGAARLDERSGTSADFIRARLQNSR